MRFAPEGDHGANAGLKAARDFLAPVKGTFPGPLLCPAVISNTIYREVPLDHILGPLDSRWSLCYPRDARTNNTMETRPYG